MKDNLSIRKHLCAILLLHHKLKRDTEMQDNDTTKGKQGTIDNRRLIEDWKKEVPVGISTIYYWIHHGTLGLTKQNLLYPRKGKTVKKQVSPNFKPVEKGHDEMDTVLLTRAKNDCLLVLTDRKSRYQMIPLIPNQALSRSIRL